jgi:ribosome biogenesis ATPase
LPAALQHSAIATFLRLHPAPLTEDQLQLLSITADDFAAALPTIQPSSKREGFATVPEVTWSDIGALEATREELEMSIVEPIKHPELFKAVGVNNSGGVLLWGPPGCGKTLLAKAVANESGANFISVKGPELLNKYVGESERAVRQVFARARTSSPCVIFFDELDALVPRRDDALSESSSRVVNTLLTELDGLEARVQTFVIGATNRPDMIDPAMCRPGRLDKLLYVDLPNPLERIKILRTLTKKTPLRRLSVTTNESTWKNEDVDLTSEAEHAAQDGVLWLCHIAVDARCNGFSGADLAALVREASVLALRNQLRLRRDVLNSKEADGVRQRTPTIDATSIKSNLVTFSMGAPKANIDVLVDVTHFEAALDKVQPSVGVAQRKKYGQLRSRLSGLPGTGSNATHRRSDNDVAG